MWLSIFLKAFSAIPYIVAGIEHIHGDAKSGADKATLAQESLGLASATASAFAPAADQQIVANFTNLASQTITAVQQAFAASGTPTNGVVPPALQAAPVTAAPTPAPAPVQQ